MNHPQGGAGVPALINWNDNINTFDFFRCLNSISRLVQMLVCYVWLNIAFYMMKSFIFSVPACRMRVAHQKCVMVISRLVSSNAYSDSTPLLC